MRVGIYLSSDPAITTADVYLGDYYVYDLSPGVEQINNISVFIPATATGGTNYIGAIADYDGRIAESNENNNALAGNVISVTKRYPDLIMTNVSGPTSARLKQTATFAATVQNTGVVGAGEGYVGFYLSTDVNISTSDVYLGQAYQSSLASGGQQEVSLTVTIPANLARGSYYIGALADRGSVVAETDETNNGVTGNLITISR